MKKERMHQLIGLAVEAVEWLKSKGVKGYEQCLLNGFVQDLQRDEKSFGLEEAKKDEPVKGATEQIGESKEAPK